MLFEFIVPLESYERVIRILLVNKHLLLSYFEKTFVK